MVCDCSIGTDALFRCGIIARIGRISLRFAMLEIHQYRPTMRGFVVGLALFAGVCVSLPGCLDTGRMQNINGKDVVTEKGKVVAEKAKTVAERAAELLDDPQPTFKDGFKDGRNEAKQQFKATVTKVTNWIIGICAACAAGCVLMGIASIWVPWICKRCAIVGAAISVAAVVGMSGVQFIAVVYGAIAVEIAFWLTVGLGIVAAIAFGVPLVRSWFARSAWHRGVALATEDGAAKTREGVAILAAVSPTIDAMRKQAVELIDKAQTAAGEEATAARAKLAEVGVKI